MPIANFLRKRLIPAALSGVMTASSLLSAAVPVQAWAQSGSAAMGRAMAGRTPPGLAFGQAHVASHSRGHGRVARDLDAEMRAPGQGRSRWSRHVNGAHMVQLVVTSDSTDPQMTILRNEVARLGGNVVVVHSAFRALTVVMPASRVQALSRVPEVLNIAPNRSTQGSASTVESVAGANISGVRSYTSSTSYAGYDGSGVGIAILDSGVMKAHKDFFNASSVTRVKRNVDMLNATLSNWSYINDPNMSPEPGSAALASYEAAVAADSRLTQDPYGHGTHVASVAAGRGFYQAPDSTGVAPNANIYDVKVLNSLGYGTLSDALEGINWVMYHAREYNIRVLNISLAAQSTDSWQDDPLCTAVRAAASMGITVVAAAGNFGVKLSGAKVYGSVASPGNDPSVITVGAVNFKGTNARNDDVVNNFSSRGPTRGLGTNASGALVRDNLIKPDLVAPGNRIIGALATQASSTTPTKNTLASVFPTLVSAAAGPSTYGQQLMMLSGTSIAAPVVAGAAAVLLQANPGLTPPLIKAILQYTAQPLPNYNLLEQGAGQINLEGAVRLATSLRTDIASAIQAGTLVHGSTSLLAAGKVMPTRSSSVAGTTFNWSRVAIVGGGHLASGDKLFTTYQRMWDPRLTWANGVVVQTDPIWWSGTGYAANTFPAWFYPYTIDSTSLVSSGVVLADGLVGTSSMLGRTGLFTPTATLAGWLVSGSGQVLSSGVVLSSGIVLSEGLVLSEGIVLSEGLVMSEGLVLSEGLVMSEGIVLSETGSSVTGYNTSGALNGE